MSAKLYYVADLEFQCLQDPITIGDGKFFVTVPFDGEILGARNAPKAKGVILNAGTGAGTVTQVQIHNVTQGRDYFTTVPYFRVDAKDANGRAPLEGGVLCLQPSFKSNDSLRLDIDGIPGGADSANGTIWVTCGFWREVT